MKEPFRSDVEAIRQRAREHMGDGAVIGVAKDDAARIVDVLNDVLATEIVCVLRYKNHFYTAKGRNSAGAAAEFKQHAEEEQGHADAVAERIVQLGGNPDFNPASLATRSHAEYQEGDALEAMLKEDLVAERIAIETYTDIIRWLGDDDVASRQLLIDILRIEQEHAEDLSSLLGRLASAS